MRILSNRRTALPLGSLASMRWSPPRTQRLDFHPLAESAVRILIELAVRPKLIQMMLRHSDIKLTMDLYGELREDDLFGEQPKFPVPRIFATGDDGPDGSRPLAVAT